MTAPRGSGFEIDVGNGAGATMDNQFVFGK